MPAHPVRFLAESKDNSRALLDALTGEPIFWWRGVDVSMQIALADYGKFILPADVGTIAIEIKPVGAHAMDPNLVRKEFTSEDCDATFVGAHWGGGAKALLTAAFTAEEISLPPGRYRLIVSHEKDGLKNTYASTAVLVADSQSGYDGVEPPPAPGWWLGQYAVIGMVDLDEAPVATITNVRILTGHWAGVDLIPATPDDPDWPYKDTDGRQPFTVDGKWNDGALYDPDFSYRADFDEWRLSGQIGPGINGNYGSGASDLTANGANGWPWAASVGLSGLPTFEFTFATDIPGVPGTFYRVPIDGGLFRIYQKQPDKSFALIATVDANGENVDILNAYKRSYHTGTQTAATISDFGPAVGALSVLLTGNQTKAGRLTHTTAPRSTGAVDFDEPTDMPNIGQIEQLLTSPDLVWFRDHFFNIAQWYPAHTGTGGLDLYYLDAGGRGGVGLQTGATSGSIAGLATAINGNLSPIALKPWELRFVIKTDSINNCKIRVGLSGNGNSFSQNLWAVGGMGFDYNPALSPNWRFANDPVGGAASYVDSGVPVAIGTVYGFKIRSAAGNNQCHWSVNGGAETLLASDARDYIAGPALAIQNTSAISRKFIPIFCSFIGKT